MHQIIYLKNKFRNLKKNIMENPELKALLKSAKEAIKSKEFGEALKICKVIIFFLVSIN